MYVSSLKSHSLKFKLIIDINECHLKLHDCDSDSSCINTIGSFYCKCAHGFEIDEFKKCHGTYKTKKFNFK